MDQYNQEERRHDRDDPDRQGSPRSGTPSEFPWEEPPGTNQPAPVWEDRPSMSEQPAVHTRSGRGPDHGTQAAAASAVVNVTTPGQTPGNGMAVAGFVLSLVMWIPIPFLNIVLWVLAVTFSSIGLTRANKQGLPPADTAWATAGRVRQIR